MVVGWDMKGLTRGPEGVKIVPEGDLRGQWGPEGDDRGRGDDMT